MPVESPLSSSFQLQRMELGLIVGLDENKEPSSFDFFFFSIYVKRNVLGPALKASEQTLSASRRT